MLTDQAQKSNPIWKAVTASSATTIAVWTPRASARILLTGLDISSGGTATTVHVFYSTSLNQRGTKVAVYAIGTTAVILPRFSGLDGGMDVPLNVQAASAAVEVTATGFEVAG